jgi:hypothetical protein
MTQPDENERDEDTEVTPGGLEVRTPTRDEFFGNLRRASRPEPESEPEADENASKPD